MTKLYSRDIPSAFIRTDGHISDADNFINVRDLQTAALNINALIAKRMRHPVLTLRFASATDNTPLDMWGWGDIQSVLSSGNTSLLMGSYQIWMPPMATHVDVRVRARMSSADGDGYIYPVVAGPTTDWSPTASNKITVTGVSAAEYNIDVPVPPEVARIGWGRLKLYFTNELANQNDVETSGTPTVSDAVVVDAGIGPGNQSWVRIDAEDAAYGDIIGFDNTNITPLVITDIQPVLDTNAASNTEYIYYVRGIWNELPVVGDLAYVWALSVTEMFSICVTPKRVADFVSAQVVSEY